MRDHGLRLLPSQYERYNPMKRDEAASMEVELGIRLRLLDTASGKREST